MIQCLAPAQIPSVSFPLSLPKDLIGLSKVTFSAVTRVSSWAITSIPFANCLTAEKVGTFNSRPASVSLRHRSVNQSPPASFRRAPRGIPPHQTQPRTCHFHLRGESQMSGLASGGASVPSDMGGMLKDTVKVPQGPLPIESDLLLVHRQRWVCA